MVILDLYEVLYEKVPTPTKNFPNNYSWKRTTVFSGLSPKNSFWKQMKLKKASVGFTCGCCRKKRGKGMRYIGSNWEKVCHFCLKEWIVNSKETLKQMGEFMDKQGKELEVNEDKWYKEAMVGQLQ